MAAGKLLALAGDGGRSAARPPPPPARRGGSPAPSPRAPSATARGGGGPCPRPPGRHLRRRVGESRGRPQAFQDALGHHAPGLGGLRGLALGADGVLARGGEGRFGGAGRAVGERPGAADSSSAPAARRWAASAASSASERLGAAGGDLRGRGFQGRVLGRGLGAAGCRVGDAGPGVAARGGTSPRARLAMARRRRVRRLVRAGERVAVPCARRSLACGKRPGGRRGSARPRDAAPRCRAARPGSRARARAAASASACSVAKRPGLLLDGAARRAAAASACVLSWEAAARARSARCRPRGGPGRRASRRCRPLGGFGFGAGGAEPLRRPAQPRRALPETCQPVALVGGARRLASACRRGSCSRPSARPRLRGKRAPVRARAAPAAPRPPRRPPEARSATRARASAGGASTSAEKGRGAFRQGGGGIEEAAAPAVARGIAAGGGTQLLPSAAPRGPPGRPGPRARPPSAAGVPRP